ncbi:MFS transporter [Pontimicrobium sp. IMCC45349]|uniref:MFS transporter n=1 Tax=Pontimicrobium sp. IMCC45349 TaxID=3391574 RepID=UPI0039A09DA9
MKTLFTNYLNTFRGLSREVWWLSLITFINRAGTMVVPFLTIYLKSLDFSASNVGWIMSAFGLGSFVGSWLGGKLTDKFGYYRIMTLSLIGSGIIFIWLQSLETLNEITLGIFILMTVADMFRPAMFVAVSAYSKPENKTRSITLIRLAINLGFSGGPALGGLIIVTLGYAGLFWVDGVTCILAGLLLLVTLNPKKSTTLDEITIENPKSAYKDFPYIIFLISMVLFGVAFLQYFSTIPLYYKEIHCLPENEIGLLMAMNGILIFLLEMPLVKWLENSRFTMVGLIIFGGILTVFSFLVLNLSDWAGVLIIGMLFMTIGEMISFPFSNAFAMKRAKLGNQGEFMALYSMTFAISHIIGHNTGLQLIDNFGYETTWNAMTILMIVCILVLVYLKQLMKKQTV